MRLSRPNLPLAAPRASGGASAALASAVRRLAKLIGSGAHEGAQLEQAWSDVTEQTNASASATLGQDELALLAALIRDGVGGAQPVVLVHTLIWQSAPRRAQVATSPKIVLALLKRTAAFETDEDAAAVSAMAVGDLCRSDGATGSSFAPEVMAAQLSDDPSDSALAILCRVVAARHPNRLLTGSVLSAVCDISRGCPGARPEIARQEGLLEGLAWCLDTDGGVDRCNDLIDQDQDQDRDQCQDRQSPEDEAEEDQLVWRQDVRAAAAWAVEALAREPGVAAAAAATAGITEGLRRAAEVAALARSEARAALDLLAAAAVGGSGGAPASASGGATLPAAGGAAAGEAGGSDAAAPPALVPCAPEPAGALETAASN